MAAKQAERTQPRRRGLFVVVLLLCLAGLAAGIELTVVHVRAFHDADAQSFCAFNSQFNCDTVARSYYSVFLRVPVAVWGILGYLCMSLLALWGWRSRQPAAATGLLLGLVGVSVATSAVLGTISVVKITSICVVCVATYVVNLALLVVCLMQARREGVRASLVAGLGWARTSSTHSVSLGAAGLAGVGLLIWLYPQYWEGAAQAGPLGVKASASTVLIDGMTTGETEKGHPWIGAAEPELVIEEFSDYECPFCGQAHWVMRELVEANPDQLQLIHRHFPLDQACNPTVQRPFHMRSCAFAAIAVCAQQQDRFWQANDYLFEHGRVEGPFSVGEMCAKVGLDEKKLEECMVERASELLAPDLRDGILAPIQGTPTFRIQGELYMGRLPEKLLEPYLKKLEEKLDREMAQGK